MHAEIVRTDADQPYHVRLVAENGEKVWWTENYASRFDAIHALTLLGSMFGRDRWEFTKKGNGTIEYSASAYRDGVTTIEVDERTKPDA
jgi:uncharacterized protein YegP (UPF0339 family)